MYADQVYEFGLTAIFISPLTNAILSAWLKTPFTSSSAAGLRELRLLISCQTSDIRKWDFDTNERECRAFRTAWVMVCASKMWSAIQLDWSQPILPNTHTSAHTWLSHWYLKMLHPRLILYKHAVGTPISGSPILGAVPNLQVRRCQRVRINKDIVNWRHKDQLKDRWSREQIGDSQHEFEMPWVRKPAEIRRTHWYQIPTSETVCWNQYCKRRSRKAKRLIMFTWVNLELVVDWYNSIQIADHYAFSETARISELVEGRRGHQREH